MPADLGDRLPQLIAQVTLRQARSADLVRFACDLLVAGVSPESAVGLAGLPFTAAMHDAEPLFRRLVADLGRPEMTIDKAGWLLARRAAEQLLAKSLPAADAARLLWGLWWECGNPSEIGAFVQLLDAWEERLQGERAPIEAEMRALAPAVIAAADDALGR